NGERGTGPPGTGAGNGERAPRCPRQQGTGNGERGTAFPPPPPEPFRERCGERFRNGERPAAERAGCTRHRGCRRGRRPGRAGRAGRRRAGEGSHRPVRDGQRQGVPGPLPGAGAAGVRTQRGGVPRGLTAPREQEPPPENEEQEPFPGNRNRPREQERGTAARVMAPVARSQERATGGTTRSTTATERRQIMGIRRILG